MGILSCDISHVDDIVALNAIPIWMKGQNMAFTNYISFNVGLSDDVMF